MANKEKIDHLLLDIRALETLVAGVRDAEFYPVSFFSKTFDLTHKLLKELHALEGEQIETLRRQMEEHRQLIQSIPVSKAAPLPDPIVPLPEPVIEQPELVVKQPEPVVEQPEVRVEQLEVVVEQPKVVEAVTEPVTKPETDPEPDPVVVEAEPTPKKEPATEKPHAVLLNEFLEKKNLTDFRKAFSLNDHFYFRRELFGGDEAKMNKVLLDMNEIRSFEDAIAYLNEKLNWNIEDATVGEFIKLLEKRFL